MNVYVLSMEEAYYNPNHYELWAVYSTRDAAEQAKAEAEQDYRASGQKDDWRYWQVEEWDVKDGAPEVE